MDTESVWRYLQKTKKICYNLLNKGKKSQKMRIPDKNCYVKNKIMKILYLKNTPVFIALVPIFLIACSSESGNRPTRRNIIKQQGSMRESIGPDGKHLKGQMRSEYIGNEGRFIMESTAEDYHYKDVITFDDGRQRVSETIGDR